MVAVDVAGPAVFAAPALLCFLAPALLVFADPSVLVPGVGLESTALGTPVRCSTNRTSRATGHGPCPSRTSLHLLFLVRQSLYDVIQIKKYFIATCDFIGRILVSTASCIIMKTSGGKKAKNRITVALCASMTGEKLTPLVIGRCAI